ncbi:MAG: LGFP repeat-containing protein, partial [Allosphingosinicella sp.]
DELPGDDGGRYNDFENNATITWHPRAGTHVVYGLIRNEWIRLGRERRSGRCGYPTTDEYDAGGGYRRSNFQRGYIIWRRGMRTAQQHCSVLIDNGPVLVPVDE